jgi:hypothetical protein
MEESAMQQMGALNQREAGRRTSTGAARPGFITPIVGGLVVLVVLIGLIGTAIRDPRPHDIPVGLVGPAAAVQQMSNGIATAAPGTFQFTSFQSEDAARAALDSRSVAGVLVIGQAAPRLIVAGAAGDAVTGVIAAVFTKVFQAQGAALQVETVHLFSGGDAHGLVLFFLVVALMIATLVAQAVLLSEARDAGLGTRLGVVVAFAVLAGLAGMGAVAWITGELSSAFWAAAALAALASASVGAVVAGAGRLLGTAGVGLAAFVVVLLGLVSSGGPAGSEFLPDLYRWLGPWMPAGQLYSALRGALYFDGAGLGWPVVVLTGWLGAGLALMVLGEVVARRPRAGRAAAVTAQ